MKKNLIKTVLLVALSVGLFSCTGKKEPPITDKEESTVIKNVKDTSAYLKKKDYKSIAYAFIYNIKEGLQSYESSTTGTVKAKVAVFDYNIKYETVTHKKGNAFYSKDHSKSTFTTLDNEFYQIDRNKIVVSRDLKKYQVFTVEDYNQVSYAMNQYLIMGYVFNDESIINTELVSDKGEEALMSALEAGAEDASEEEDGIEIITAQTDLMKVRQALIDAGMTVTSAELKYVPTTTVPVEGEDEEKVSKLLEAIDDLDDVVNVFTNAA